MPCGPIAAFHGGRNAARENVMPGKIQALDGRARQDPYDL